MATKVKEVVNNIVYVEPNYVNSISEYDVNGLETYEMIPPLEDYSIYVNLEVEVRGRNVQSSKSSGGGTKLIMSYLTTTDGKSTVNFMQGSKIPIGENGATINSLTTNYTDIFIKDLKATNRTTELFGIKSIDIAYNNYMVPEVTIEFVDVRGASLFAPKEYYESNKNTDKAIDADNEENIANSFFQCFFTLPYPKYTLLVKGFYGQAVAYELTYADFRARFESSTGNFSCTAKFVGYHFSFLNDVMMNGIVAAPYSDYIGASYWTDRKFTITGNSGEEIAMPKIGSIIAKMKTIEANADRMLQSDPVAQEKIATEQKTSDFSSIEQAYRNFIEEITNRIPEKEYKGFPLFYSVTTGGLINGMVIIEPSWDENDPDKERNKEYRDYCNDSEDAIVSMFNNLKTAIDEYNSKFPDDKLPLPEQFYDERPKRRICSNSNNASKASITCANHDMKEECPNLYNKFKNGVEEGNKRNVNPYLSYRNAYYYYDKGFCEKLSKLKDDNTQKDKEVADRIENLKDTYISEQLGFHPTIENITRIVMAHFETFVNMIFATAKNICAESPQRTIQSLQVSDANDISDVKNKTKDKNLVVPPFPNVTKEIRRNGTVDREEAWVGDYAGNFKEKDLVHGIINGVAEVAEYIERYEDKEAGDVAGAGSTGAVKSAVKCPLSLLDIVATAKPYMDDGFDQNDPKSLLSLVAMRGISIFGLSNMTDIDGFAEKMGEADAMNFLDNHKIGKEMLEKINPINENDVINLIEGKESKDSNKTWPWTNNSSVGGMVAETNSQLYLQICKYKAQENETYCVPYQNLGWKKIINETITSGNGAKAAGSNEYINTFSLKNVNKTNYFTFDTNINRISHIVEKQMVADGLSVYQEKFLNECQYNKEKYLEFFDNTEKIIAYIIDNAKDIIPSDESCMLPSSKKYFSDKQVGGGYNMNDFVTETPGEGGESWIDKNGNQVRRKGSGGCDVFFDKLSPLDFCVTELPGLDYNLNAKTGNSIFGQWLYYKQKTARAQALLFLASLGYFIQHKDVIENAICNDKVTMAIIPLPTLMFAGALLWADRDKDKKPLEIVNSVEKSMYSGSLKLLKTLRHDIQRRLIHLFAKWVDGGVEGDTLLGSFQSIKKGLEIQLINPETIKKEGQGYDFLFDNVGEQEDNATGWLAKMSNNGWIKKFDPSYDKVMAFYRGEFSDAFFANYICVDEDVKSYSVIDKIAGNDYTYGFRFGLRDGGPSALLASNFALAGCVFAKNSKFYKHDVKNAVTVKVNTLKAFIGGFLKYVKTNTTSEGDTVDTQVSQAKDPKTNTDIRIGIYRYCKMLYDKWLAGLSEEEFKRLWTIEKFFDGDDKYFHFINTYYDLANFIPLNIGNFCDEIVGCFRNTQFSLLSFLSNIYSKNKFNFLCVQNFIDLGKIENMQRMFDTVPYTESWSVKRHPNFIAIYAGEPSKYLADIDNSEYENDGFMINKPHSTENKWPEPLLAHNVSTSAQYSIPAFGVSYGKMYQSYFRDIDVSMNSPVVTEQTIKATFAIACQNNTGEQTGDRSKLYTYGQDLYSVYSSNSYACDITMMGCAWVQPLMYFVLNNVPMFRGTYQVQKVSHHIEPGNMVTKFTGVRMANVSTRIAMDEAIRSGLGQEGNNGNGDGVSIEERIADIDNNCPYKKFPLVVGGDYGEPNYSDILAGLVKDAKGNHLESPWADRKVIDTLAAAVRAESDGTTGSMLMVATIMYNRVRYRNGSFSSVLDKVQFSSFKDGNAESHYVANRNDEVSQIVQDIFTNGACATLVGQTFVTPDWDLNRNKNNDLYHFVPNKEYTYLPEQVSRMYCHGFKAEWNHEFESPKGSGHKPDNMIRHPECKLLGFMGKGKGVQAICLTPETASKLLISSSPKISKNEGKEVSDLANGFLHALNQTSKSSAVGIDIGVDMSKSKGDVLWLTNPNKSDKFATVFDMILSAYSDKVDQINWIIDNNAQNQNVVPTAYFVHVVESSVVMTIKVVYMNNLNSAVNIHVAKTQDDNSGIHPSFCKALIKKYLTPNDELKHDTNNLIDDYDAMFSSDLYKMEDCDKARENVGVSNSSFSYDPSTVKNKWQECVVKMGKWYEANVHEYSQSKTIACDLLNGTRVRMDCSGYVSACLQLFGAFGKGQNTTSCGFTSDKNIANKLQAANFKKLTYSWSEAQPFDIITYCGHVEILASKGSSPKSWSWGSCHDGLNGHSSMPSGTGKKPFGSTYKVIWRQA